MLRHVALFVSEGMAIVAAVPSSLIDSLSLHYFRNYRQAKLSCDSPFVVLTGPNGAGKTNILEAISMLSPGRGFRHAPPSEQVNPESEQSEWVVRATVRQASQLYELATASPARGEGSRRRVTIEGEPVARQKELLDYLLLIWFLPSMSHLFQEGMSARRKYLDRIVYGFDGDHASRIHAYEHYMRERKRVLAMPSPDPGWLRNLEQTMAQYSVAIGSARLMAIEQLNEAMALIDPVFPQAVLTLRGNGEDLLGRDQVAALMAEDMLCQRLEAAREQDRQSGRCGTGAHKTRLEVTFLPKAIPAEQCSTGEQKALMLSLLLAQLYAHTRRARQQPVILLDEMVAHLDEQRRQALFSVISQADVQLFATGTHREDFAALKRHDSRFFHIEGGDVVAE